MDFEMLLDLHRKLAEIKIEIICNLSDDDMSKHAVRQLINTTAYLELAENTVADVIDQY